MGEAGSQHTVFATTQWTLVGRAARGGDTEARAALETLFQTYWQPLYRYARRKGKSKEDAEDLVQGFCAHLMQGRAFARADRGKGRFRSFMVASFNHWMINQWKKDSREKRGGGVHPLSFDWQDAETGLSIDPADTRTPDQLFDREWAIALLAKVLEDLERAWCREGDPAQFARLKPCLTAGSEKIAYAELSGQLGLTEGAARVAVHRLRKRYRELLRAEIERTLTGPDAVEEETRALFAALAG